MSLGYPFKPANYTEMDTTHTILTHYCRSNREFSVNLRVQPVTLRQFPHVYGYYSKQVYFGLVWLV